MSQLIKPLWLNKNLAGTCFTLTAGFKLQPEADVVIGALQGLCTATLEHLEAACSHWSRGEIDIHGGLRVF